MVKSNNFNFEVLRKSAVRELVNRLSDSYGCNLEELKSYVFYKNLRGKVYISKVDVRDMSIDRINGVGLYLGTFHDEYRFRLSIEGSNLVGATKNFVTINSDVLKSYLAAENLFADEVDELNNDGSASFLIVRYNGESLGCVSLKEKMLLNYIPKSRKLDFNKVF